jgi:hypothetical protein
MSENFNPDKALIFRIIHKDNVPWVLINGLRCRNSEVVDVHYVSIGNVELIDRRSHRAVPHPPGGTLSDYVPFYFTPFSPMLYNIKTGYGGISKRPNSDIVILVSSLHKLRERKVPFIFTDRHAYLTTAVFYSDLADLSRIDWHILQSRDFQRDPDDPGKFERYQAEALVHKHLPIDALLGMICYNDVVTSSLKAKLAERGLTMTIVARPSWYF